MLEKDGEVWDWEYCVWLRMGVLVDVIVLVVVVLFGDELCLLVMFVDNIEWKWVEEVLWES